MLLELLSNAYMQMLKGWGKSGVEVKKGKLPPTTQKTIFISQFM